MEANAKQQKTSNSFALLLNWPERSLDA